MNLMDKEHSQQTLFETLHRHVVGLAITDVLKNPRKSPKGNSEDYNIQVFIVSTFLIMIRNIGFLITAGHVLEDIKKRLQSGRRILKSRLLDGSSGMTGSIPFELNQSKVFHRNINGDDYDLIPLEAFYSRSLSQGCIRPLTEKHWRDIPDPADNYYLIGFPKQAQINKMTENINGGKISVDLGSPLIPLQRVSSPPEALKQHVDRFYAEVPIIPIPEEIGGEKSSLTDISGMSGGPIFGVKHIEQNRLRYWIIAIQSGWLPQSRILAGCFIRPFVDGITKAIDIHYDELK